jgi:outer membrane receptor protein involved in Fe transport
MSVQSIPLRRVPLAIAIALAFSSSLAAGAENVATDLETPTVEVIGTTPIPGLGTPAAQVPSNVQVTTGKRIAEQQSLSLPDFLNQSLPSVSISEVQGNPFQPNVSFRGFEASPLLGAPQGLSVYQDGVRVNEPFGDIVNWDLIPLPAVSTMTLMPGSNPVFGLNTLGGAVEIRTKSGRQYPGLEAEVYGGSWGRKAAEFALGDGDDRADYFVAANWFDEDGWRDYSPSKVKQLFAKIGHQDRDTDIDFAITHADTDLTGNGLLPGSMLSQRREQVFTYPDNTRNKMTMLNLTVSHWMSEKFLLSGLVYHRVNNAHTLNGDINGDFVGGPNDGGAGPGTNAETAASNRTRTNQTGNGFGLQGSWVLDANTLAVGSTYDKSRSDFEQTSQLGIFRSAADRSVLETAPEVLDNSLEGTTQTTSLYATDTWSPTKELAVTVSGRFNRTAVKTTDRLNQTTPNLDGDYTYTKLNPAVGATFQVSPSLGAYAGWNQGSRAPSPIELGCADPNNPCTLPNALASDPFLQQVVTQTLEAGLRGKLSESLNWNVGVYRSVNKDDILFVGTSTSAGYFTNFGKTRRQGAEFGFSGESGKLKWSVNYSYVNATFQSSACLLSPDNSSRGTSDACTDVGAGTGDDLILVSAGNKIPGIPENQLRISGDYRISDEWSVGGTITSFSDQYARGNENNQHQSGTTTDLLGTSRTFDGPGKVGGYTILNLTTRYKIDSNWELFGKINNVFDNKYSTGAMLGENPFDAQGNFQTGSDSWTHETFYAPGAPRAIWVGVKYTMGTKP